VAESDVLPATERIAAAHVKAEIRREGRHVGSALDDDDERAAPAAELLDVDAGASTAAVYDGQGAVAKSADELLLEHLAGQSPCAAGTLCRLRPIGRAWHQQLPRSQCQRPSLCVRDTVRAW